MPTTNIVAPGGEFGSIPAGAPFFGQDSVNKNICTSMHVSKKRLLEKTNGLTSLFQRYSGCDSGLCSGHHRTPAFW